MSTLPKETLREIITSGGLKAPGDLHSYLRDIFKDTLQEMIEAELEMNLGYAKGDRTSKNTDNRRNGYSKKKVKSQFGDGDFEPSVISKNKKMAK